ncbi:MAG: PIN domain-containing protein [Burkholderiales bacterium]|nr:PIN domain-containing protein [Burkholderiales bacterium]
MFVDTNLLYYANTDSPDPRHARARQLVEPLWSEPGKAAIGVQVLQELHVNLIRKGGLDPATSWRRVSDYLAWKVIDNDRLLLAAAFDVQTRWKLSYRDSLIVAAAQRSGAPLLWSEDLAEGQRYDELRALNPLRT